MRLNKLYLILTGLFLCNIVFAQTIEPFLISSSGHLNKGSKYQVSATIGEVATTTLISGSGEILTQGFQQGEVSVITSMETKKSPLIIIWPIPATSVVKVKCPEKFMGKIMTLKNLLGTISKDYLIKNTVEEIDISDLPPGSYFIKLPGASKASQLIKI